jgi:cytochrome c-type biogenesis protein
VANEVTTHGNLRNRAPSRRFLYGIFIALAAIPVVAFAIGPLSSDSFSLGGPAGPLLAFAAGVLSFVSPCVLPLVPIYLAHLSGASVVNGRITNDRRVTFTHALVFVGAFSAVFIILGTAVGLLGSYFLKDHQRDLEEYAGLMLVGLGVLLVPSGKSRAPLRAALLLLALTGVYVFVSRIGTVADDRTRLVLLGAALVLVWLRFAGYLPLTVFARTFEVRLGEHREVGYAKSALVGGAFAIGWTPCIGPILGAILTLASTSDHALQGTYLLFAYSAGLSIPFLIAGLALADVTTFLRRLQRYSGIIEVASGVTIVAVGILLVSGSLTGLNSYFNFADFNQGL